MNKNLCSLIFIATLFIHQISLAQIQITFPAKRAVFQRNASNEAVMYVGGYYTEAFTSIEARFTPIVDGEGVDTGWQVIQQMAGGNYYGSVTVKGGWYKLEVQGKRNGQSPKLATLAEPVGVGEVFVVAGQSNATGGDGNANGPDAAHDQVNSVNFQNYNPDATPSIAPYVNLQLPCPEYVHLKKEVKTAPFGNYAWCWAAFGDKIYEKYRVPVMIFNAGWSSTGIENWQQTALDSLGTTAGPWGYVFPQGQPFGHLRVALNNYINQLGVRAVLWHQGESDNYIEQRSNAQNENLGDTYWKNRYVTMLWDVIQASRKRSAKNNLAWMVARASRFDFPVNDPARQTTVSANVIGAQNEIIDNDGAYPGVFQGPDTDPFYSLKYRKDEIHFRGDVFPSADPNEVSGLVHLAGFWADKVTPAFLSESTPYPATPPTHVVASQASGSASVTFTAPTPAPQPQYNWFLPDNCNQYFDHASQWATSTAGTYQLKVVDAYKNTVFSPKLFVSGATPLPVTLTYFTGEPAENNQTLLRWETSSENNASHYEIEKSRDAKFFEKIGAVNAVGNSNLNKAYSYQDEGTVSENRYYRLKQVDLDGKYSYSRMVHVRQEGFTAVKVYPNPVVDKLTVLSQSRLNRIEVIHISGKIVHSSNPGGQVFILDMSGFNPGLYMVKVNEEIFKIIR
ncbi:T9SS type A sorting domain-containing protein [Dyadobacter sp. 32]|uniref:T9SS type A sorting domain-containing protein n=1 Tax=Dyadobacter sp. 32 TaxID=538966 RepID=UPI0011ED98A9